MTNVASHCRGCIVNANANKNDYANTVSVWSTTTRTSCPHSQRQRRRRVRVVNDYFSMCLRNHDYMDTQISNISEKTKNVGEPFLLFIWGPGGVFFLLKKFRKSRDTVPLKRKFYSTVKFVTFNVS